MAPSETLSFTDVEAAGLSDWRQLFEALRTRFLTGSFETGLRLVNRIGELAEQANHHPDVAISWNKVTLTLSTHSAGGLTAADFALARQISALS